MNAAKFTMSNQSSPTCLSTVAGTLMVGAIALICLIAYGTSYYGWRIYLELFSHFQVQYLAVSLLLLGLLLLLRRKGFIIVGLFLCTVLALPVVSWYVPPKRVLPVAETDLRVLVANINTQNTSYDKVLSMIRAEQPNVAVMIETNTAWKEALDSLSDIFPYSSGQTQNSNFGLLVYSTIPLTNTQIEFFGTENIPSVVTTLSVNNQPVTLVATHPLPPVRPETFRSRNRQLDLIRQYLETVSGRVILAGDLNAAMWSPYYRMLERRTGLRNAREGFGVLPTWPTPDTYRSLPGWMTSLFLIPIDHCLVSDGLEVTGIHTGAATDSDHRPLITDVAIASSQGL
ncbi:MAG: endonuclease/exonuclease/phosphatase family protein [Cyanobacteria bacterium J06627_8]